MIGLGALGGLAGNPPGPELMEDGYVVLAFGALALAAGRHPPPLALTRRRARRSCQPRRVIPRPLTAFSPPGSRSHNRQHEGIGFHCVKCWTFLAERPPGNPVLCGQCRENDRARGAPGAEGEDRRPAASGLRALLGAVPGNQARASILFDVMQDGRLAGAAAGRCLAVRRHGYFGLSSAASPTVDVFVRTLPSSSSRMTVCVNRVPGFGLCSVTR
jgi:hypothetical protein